MAESRAAPTAPVAGGNRYGAGVVLLLAAGGCLSFGGLMVRHIEAADGWQILFYRSVGMAAMLLALLAMQYRGRVDVPFRSMGWGGLIAGLSLALSMITYLFALILTTVANAMFVISTAPLFVALLGWLLLRERVGLFTWLAIALAIGGIGLMFADGVAGGHARGLIIAVVCTATFAVMVVVLRRHRGVNMLPALIVAAGLAAAAAAAIAGDLAVSRHDMLLSLAMGALQVGAGNALISAGTRHVPAAEASLLLLTEVILSPIWVWLVISETPSDIALVGGLIVFGAVAAQTIAGVRRERRGLAAAR